MKFSLVIQSQTWTTRGDINENYTLWTVALLEEHFHEIFINEKLD